MKCKLHTLLCLSLLFVFSACGQDDDPIPPLKGSRTVLVYLMADNSLSSFTDADIEEMKEGMKQVDSSMNNLLVYVDGWSTTPVLYHIYKNRKGEVLKDVIKEYEEQVSTDTEVMKEVMRRAFFEYPADSYGLVLWSHGEGWIPSPLPARKSSTRWIGEDSGQHLNITDMVSVFESLHYDLDFILFDACFGQSIEVAYELRKYTDYIIGSPTEIPGPGAPYDKVVPAMFTADNVGVAVGKAYYEPYAMKYDEDIRTTNDNWTGGVSISVINCAALENLASVTKQTISEIELSSLLNSGLYDYDKGISTPRRLHVGYYDMKQLMQQLSTDMNAWTFAANNAIIYWNSTPENYSGMMPGMFSLPQETTCGVTHYIPDSSNPAADAAYRSTAWYEAAGLSNLGW